MLLKKSQNCLRLYLICDCAKKHNVVSSAIVCIVRGIQYNTNEAIDDFFPSYSIEEARQSSAGESVIVYTAYMKWKKKCVYT